MNISITLNTEQQGALDGLLADYNATRDTPVTEEIYLQTVLLGIVNDKVAKNFESTASALVSAAKSMPYEARLQLIQEVQTKLQS
jgi:hypothetical protein